MTTSTAALQSPGQLIANLPAILGFYPHDSVIFAAFRHTGFDNRFLLGPIMRVDLDDLAVLPEVASSLDHDEYDVVFAVIITKRNDDELQESVDELFAVAKNGVIPINACWLAPEILTGIPIELVFGPASSDGEWADSVIAPVLQADAMGPLLEQGELPELNREEYLDYFTRFTPQYSPSEADRLGDKAHHYAVELLRNAEYNDHPAAHSWDSVRGVIADLHLVLVKIDEHHMDTEKIMADEETLLGTAMLLAEVRLRDLVFENIITQPRPAARLMLAVARTFGGNIRANALCGYTLAALELGLTMRATPALLAAQSEDPGHSLSALMLQACRAGEFDQLIYAIRRGSLMMREQHNIIDPDMETNRPSVTCFEEQNKRGHPTG